MEATEGLAIVKFHAPVGQIQCIQRCGKALAEFLAERQIKGSVSWQMVSRIWLIWEGITETGAVVDVGGGKRTPR